MSGNSHDRRVDNRAFNIMQRVFDELPTERGLTIEELEHRTRYMKASIVGALKRLQLRRCLRPASCVDGVWTYSKRPDAERPVDRRGGSRQMMQAMAA